MEKSVLRVLWSRFRACMREASLVCDSHPPFYVHVLTSYPIDAYFSIYDFDFKNDEFVAPAPVVWEG